MWRPPLPALPPSLLLNTYSSGCPKVNAVAKILLDTLLLDRQQQQTEEKLNLHSRPCLSPKDCSRKSAESEDMYVFKAIDQYHQTAF